MEIPPGLKDKLKNRLITPIPIKAGNYTCLGDLKFSPEVLAAHNTTLILLENQEEACGHCETSDHCLLGINGWQIFLDRELSLKYGYPYCRYRLCSRARQVQAQKDEGHWLGAKFGRRNFDTFEVTLQNQAALEVCQEYASSLTRQTKGGLLLAGPVGTGKTHLAAAILKTAFSRDIPSALIAVPKLLESMRQGFSDNTTRDLTEKVANKIFLVLDDLGAERVTEWTQGEIFLLINERYEKELPTVITTNCTLPEMERQIGQRTADRLREMCTLVPIGGPSWRTKLRQV